MEQQTNLTIFVHQFSWWILCVQIDNYNVLDVFDVSWRTNKMTQIIQHNHTANVSTLQVWCHIISWRKTQGIIRNQFPSPFLLRFHVRVTHNAFNIVKLVYLHSIIFCTAFSLVFSILFCSALTICIYVFQQWYKIHFS